MLAECEGSVEFSARVPRIPTAVVWGSCSPQLDLWPHFLRSMPPAMPSCSSGMSAMTPRTLWAGGGGRGGVSGPRRAGG